MAAHGRDHLPPKIREQYDQLVGIADRILEAFDEAYESMPGEVRAQYDQIVTMPPSAMRDELLHSLFRIGTCDHDYFDWNGIAVRVACAGGAVETFTDGLWRPGGPSRSVRDEDCEPLTIEQLSTRHPETRRSRPLT